MAFKPKIHFKNRLPFIKVMPMGLSYDHSSSTEYIVSFGVMRSDAQYRSKSNKEKWLFFSMSPKDNVSKTRTIYSGRMKTEMPGQRALSNRALRSKNINKIQIFQNDRN